MVADALAEQLAVSVSAEQIAGTAGPIPTRFFFVASGDWDRVSQPLQHTRAWRIMASIHETEGDWRRSAELEPMLARVRQGYRGGRDYPMRGRRDVERYFASRAELWQRCRQAGIARHPHAPIRFALARTGAYLKASDGAHRLCCAILLAQCPVPGQIWQVHPGYLEPLVEALYRRRRDGD